jgi:hypothetical protein
MSRERAIEGQIVEKIASGKFLRTREDKLETDYCKDQNN